MTRKASRDPGQDADRLVPEQREATRGAPATRRERLRRQTREQIKAAARELLAPHHSGELSLRAVARAVGMAPSGIYRYFESRDDLVAALARDAHESAQAALTRDTAHLLDAGTVSGPEHLEQALAIAHAYRRWCLGHRAEFSLLFAIEQDPAALAARQAAHEDVHPFFAAPLQHYVHGVRSGVVDASAPVGPRDPGLSASAEAMRAAYTPDLAASDIGVLLWGWASLQGFISLEILGPLGLFYADPEAAFDQHARRVFAAMGYREN